MPIPNKGAEKDLGGHCMVFTSVQVDGATFVGGVPGRKYRKSRNSWGLNWGIPASPGHVWTPVDEVTDGDSSDFWVVTTMGDPAAPTPPAPGPGPGPTPVPTPTPPGPTPPPSPPDYGPTIAAVGTAVTDARLVEWITNHHWGETHDAAAHLAAIMDAYVNARAATAVR